MRKLFILAFVPAFFILAGCGAKSVEITQADWSRQEQLYGKELEIYGPNIPYELRGAYLDSVVQAANYKGSITGRTWTEYPMATPPIRTKWQGDIEIIWLGTIPGEGTRCEKVALSIPYIAGKKASDNKTDNVYKVCFDSSGGVSVRFLGFTYFKERRKEFLDRINELKKPFVEDLLVLLDKKIVPGMPEYEFVERCALMNRSQMTWKGYLVTCTVLHQLEAPRIEGSVRRNERKTFITMTTPDDSPVFVTNTSFTNKAEYYLKNARKRVGR